MSQGNAADTRELIAAEFLNQSYQITCSPEERNLLGQAIALLQERLQAAKVRQGVGVQRERALLMVALNLAADLQRSQGELQQAQHTLETVTARLQNLVDMGQGAE
ncbi:cell division protein ZapA [Acidithiobacillus sp. AMEEHan]|uniref:cell division protein ZapA n=1 Tax=Acidithiobacillus sp. AMEEHan TaxID=2994951 RepID=UPI0027E49F6B|nr:cell division protein ZapA [Acidithiobacillus sp. AMEEHan]